MIVLAAEVRDEAVACNGFRYLEGVLSFVVDSIRRQSHDSAEFDTVSHQWIEDGMLDSFVSAWSRLKRLDEGGGQLRKPQLENGRKLGFRAESPLPLVLTIQHQTGQICYRISYLTNMLTSQRMR